MSTVSTEGIPETEYLPSELQQHLLYLSPEDGSTAPLVLNADAPVMRGSAYLKRSATALTVATAALGAISSGQIHPAATALTVAAAALGAILPGDSSGQIHPVWGAVIRPLQEAEEKVADFFEPVTSNWDEDGYIARAAARTYGEQTHADY